MFGLLLVVGVLLAYANGANDNIKGAATLVGGRTMSLRPALWMATGATLAGSLTAVVLARGLLLKFSGKGLVPAQVVADPRFALSVALAAGLTVLLATRIGMPISTTHALIGGLVGAGWMSSPTGLALAGLGRGLLLPLLTSPLLAIAITAAVYPLLRRIRRRTGITHESCVCVGPPLMATADGALLELGPAVATGEQAVCRQTYGGQFLGVSAAAVVDGLHVLSAAAVSFARGLNDAPKIAALLLVAGAVSNVSAVAVVAVAMAIGGLLSAWRVARTMSFDITDMNPGQGLTANLTTAALVIGASRMGLPVSTTHVSCGALFGIGTVTGQGHAHTIRQVIVAWLFTLPFAAVLAIGAAAILR